MMRYALDAQHRALLEGPRSNIKCKEGIPIIPAAHLLLRLLLLRIRRKRIAKHLDPASPHNAPPGLGLEARKDGEVRAGPEALAAALGRVDEDLGLGVLGRVRREALRGRLQDRHELRAGAQRERGAGEANLLAALESIRTSALRCEYVLPKGTTERPPERDVRVTTTVAADGVTTVVDHVPGANACAGGPGWFYDVDETSVVPTRVVLCPISCNPLTKGMGNRLDVAIGCGSL